MGYRLRWPKKNLTHCPGWVDHYNLLIKPIWWALYLMKILGFAKILGGAAILYGKFPRLKEWAYAGFAFDYLGAAASHVFANDSVNAIPPLVFFWHYDGNLLSLV